MRMKNKDYFKEALTMVLRNKKKKFYILITIISTVLVCGILIFNNSVNNYLNQSITKNIGFRTLVIPIKTNEGDLAKEELESINHIEEIYSTKYSPQFVETNLEYNNVDGKIEILYGTPNTIPNVVIGRDFEEDEKNSLICPINFYPNSSIYKINYEDMIKGENILGKEIILKYNTYNLSDNSIIKEETAEMKVKIVGLYDSKSVMGFNNQCYISGENMTEIVDSILKNESDTIVYNYYVVVDDVNNLNSVINDAIKLGFDEKSIYIANSVDTELLSIIQVSICILLALVLCVIIIITSSYTKKRVVYEKTNMGILRACGYNKKVVRNLYLVEIFFTNLFSYVAGVVTFLIMYFILNSTLLKSLTYLGIKISFSTLTIICSFLIIVIIPIFIAIININRKNQLDIINLIENNEE